MPTLNRHESQPGMFTVQDELWLPRSIQDVFAFFADAHRLEQITPTWLHFQVQTPAPVPMFPGAMIDYRLQLHGIPMRWRSEISEWEPPVRFVDRQVIGPYRHWNHQHTFEEKDGGTLVRDHVDYAVPGGRLVNWLFVAPDLHRIFAFRRQRLRELLDRQASAFT